MTRRYSGNFQTKHAAGTKIDAGIMTQVSTNLIEGRITCAAAHAIAASLTVSPMQVGVAIDLQNGRMTACQLGLFGYGKTKRIAQDGPEIDTGLVSAIKKRLVEHRLSCADAWSIADACGVPRRSLCT